MDSNDPEERISELERQLSDETASPPENFPGQYGVGLPQPPGMSPPTSTPAPGGYRASYDFPPHPIGRRHRFRYVWAVVPVIFVTLVIGGLNLHSEHTADRSKAGAEVVQPGGNMTLEPSGETLTLECDQGDVVVGGKTNVVNVTGHCAHLTVEGSGNIVIVDTADKIDTRGSDNHVVYRTGAPQISNSGSDNIVTKG
jgi:hypothetical protein